MAFKIGLTQLKIRWWWSKFQRGHSDITRELIWINLISFNKKVSTWKKVELAQVSPRDQPRRKKNAFFSSFRSVVHDTISEIHMLNIYHVTWNYFLFLVIPNLYDFWYNFKFIDYDSLRQRTKTVWVVYKSKRFEPVEPKTVWNRLSRFVTTRGRNPFVPHFENWVSTRGRCIILVRFLDTAALQSHNSNQRIFLISKAILIRVASFQSAKSA